jgi:hypothetical protein
LLHTPQHAQFRTLKRRHIHDSLCSAGERSRTCATTVGSRRMVIRLYEYGMEHFSGLPPRWTNMGRNHKHFKGVETKPRHQETGYTSLQPSAPYHQQGTPSLLYLGCLIARKSNPYQFSRIKLILTLNARRTSICSKGAYKYMHAAAIEKQSKEIPSEGTAVKKTNLYTRNSTHDPVSRQSSFSREKGNRSTPCI